MDRYTLQQLPPQYRPLGAWAYFGYSLLFSVPVVGVICLIIFSISGSNINRRNYARSFWCVYVLAAIAAVVLWALGFSVSSIVPSIQV